MVQAQDQKATKAGPIQKETAKLEEGAPHEGFGPHEAFSGRATTGKSQEQSLKPPQHVPPYTRGHNAMAAYSAEESQKHVQERDGSVSGSTNGECGETAEHQQPDRKQYTAEGNDTTLSSHSSGSGAIAAEKSRALPEGPDNGGEPQPKRHKSAGRACYELVERTTARGTERQNQSPRSIQTGDSPAKVEQAQDCGSRLTTYEGCSIDDETPCSTKAGTSLSPAEPAGMYQNAWVLAPMVRISTLPFRLECLKYGADLVYSEEIIDRKLLETKRHINKDFGTIEYISRSEKRCVFSTCEDEKGKVVLQLGTANATQALQAATIALSDIAAVDVNMGCPKSFSYVSFSQHGVAVLTNRGETVKGGMGAALLQTPYLAMDILKTLTRTIPCPVTCKIRLLDTLEETVDFARKCESTGISAIAVHARERHERPAHRANWQAFPVLRDALNIPLIANGDFLSPQDAVLFQETYGIRNLMFARGAMWDPSLFAHKPGLQTEGAVNLPVTRTDVLQSYIKRAVQCGAVYQSIKFTLQEMTGRDSNRDLKLQLAAANSTAKVCSVFGLDDFYNGIGHVPYANTLNYHKNIDLF